MNGSEKLSVYSNLGPISYKKIGKGKVSISGQSLDGAYKDQVEIEVRSQYSYLSTSSTENDIILSIGDSEQLDVYIELLRVLVEKSE